MRSTKKTVAYETVVIEVTPEEARKIATGLMVNFNWSGSPEGDEFWDSVHEMFDNPKEF